MIKINKFSGEIPILENQLLPDNAASAATNCKYNTGGITPLRAYTTLDGKTSPSFSSLDKFVKKIFVYDNGDSKFLFQSQDPDASFVANPLANDAHKRVFWTDVSGVKFAAKDMATDSKSSVFPSSSYDLGVPAPSSPPQVKIVDEAADSGGMYDTAFIYTFVSKYGEESQPSYPTSAITVYDATKLTITAPTVPTANVVISKYRVYMLSNGVYQLMAEQAIASDITVTLSSVQLGEDIQTVDYAPPPSNLSGLTFVPGGFLAGFFDNTLCFSEPYMPYAWPTKYYVPLTDKIIGIVGTYSGLLVMTDSQPYLVAGTSPFGMSPMPLDVKLPCVSRGSIVDMGEYALYASPEGIVAFDGTNATLISKQTFTVRQWEELSPSTMRCYRMEDTYLCITTVDKIFAFNPSDKTVTYMDFGVSLGACCQTDESKLISVATDSAGNMSLVKLDSSTTRELPINWSSKLYIADTLFTFSDARVRCTNGIDVTFTYYDDIGNVIKTFTKKISNSAAFRLPATKAKMLKFNFSGNGKVESINIGSSPTEV